MDGWLELSLVFLRTWAPSCLLVCNPNCRQQASHRGPGCGQYCKGSSPSLPIRSRGGGGGEGGVLVKSSRVIGTGLMEGSVDGIGEVRVGSEVKRRKGAE